MRTCIGGVLLSVLALAPVSVASKSETLEQLIARADAARPDQQADLYLQIADLELKSANEAYKASKWDVFRTGLHGIVKYSDSAHTAALHSTKHIKHTEIKLRQISARLRDIKLNVDLDDQAEVQSVIDRLEAFRSELLHNMFGSKDND